MDLQSLINDVVGSDTTTASTVTVAKGKASEAKAESGLFV